MNGILRLISHGVTSVLGNILTNRCVGSLLVLPLWALTSFVVSPTLKTLTTFVRVMVVLAGFNGMEEKLGG